MTLFKNLGRHTVHPESSGHTGLTGADSWLSFARVNVLVSSLLSRVVAVSSLVHFGAQ
jgi:hypothetical protein